MVGRRHGRPYSWGVCYGAEHVRVGFSPPLVGVQLFPIQLVEAVFVAATVTVGTVMVLSDAAPGSALAFYSIAYGVARCVFEIFRGDDVRPYWRGGSEAQWTSLVIMAVVLGLSRWWPVPFGSWLLVTTLGLGAVLLGSALTDGPLRRLFRPRHVGELARLLELNDANAQATGRFRSQDDILAGLRVSASTIHDGERWIDVFAFSFSEESGRLDEGTARKLARLISRLRRAVAEAKAAQARMACTTSSSRPRPPSRSPRMPSEFPRSPRLLKGALVVFETAAPGADEPHRLPVQPRPMTPQLRSRIGGAGRGPQQARAGDTQRVLPPTEIFHDDGRARRHRPARDPASIRSRVAVGLHPTLAALELLLYPPSTSLILNKVLALAGLGASSARRRRRSCCSSGGRCGSSRCASSRSRSPSRPSTTLLEPDPRQGRRSGCAR